MQAMQVIARQVYTIYIMRRGMTAMEMGTLIQNTLIIPFVITHFRMKMGSMEI